MRISLSIGLFAALLAGSTSIANASLKPPAAQSAAADVQSPDVATWTAAAVSATDVAPARVRHMAHLHATFAGRILSRTSSIAQGLTRSALHFLGTPYVFGGTSTGGFDCSGYVQHVFALLGFHIPRTADAQFYAGSRIRGGMKPGDLVFFQTYEPGPSHVGIYLGNGRFAHASSSHGVMVSSLGDSYWGPRYLGAKRLIASR